MHLSILYIAGVKHDEYNDNVCIGFDGASSGSNKSIVFP
jgi:hypothetical protein